MESYFETTIKPYKETDNVLYNVINSQDPQQIFLYASIIVIAIFISTKISYNTNILIGLVFCSLIILYLYTYRKYNILTDEEKFTSKFNSIDPTKNILIKYPKIIDFLFYFENFKHKNINGYNEIIRLFEEFCKIYEYCLIDYSFISSNYQKLIDYKIKILSSINSFIFIYSNANYDDILLKQKISAEKILNELLNNLVIFNKKKLYYDGYNNGTINIDYSNILPYNILNEPNYKPKTDIYNIGNLIFY